MNNKRSGPILIFSGLLLIAAALCLCVYNLIDESRASDSVTTALEQLQSEPEQDVGQGGELPDESDLAPGFPEQPAYILNPEMQMPVQFVDGWDYVGILEIPVLGLQLPVISQWSYQALKIAPCRYHGSAYTDDLVLAAHNYASHFGTLSNLTNGDLVTFTDMDGNVFQYQVSAIETLMPGDVAEMTNGQWALTLFTCTIGGQYRVTVRCDRIT